jgi:DNA polymerase
MLINPEMKNSLLQILKSRSTAGSVLLYRNDEEKGFLKSFLLSSGVSSSELTESNNGFPMPLCEKCPAIVERKKPFGTGINGVMIILNAPRMANRVEVEYFRTESVSLLKKMISSIGLELNDCYITNLIKCESGDPIIKPSDMLKNCLDVLKSEVQIIKPRVAIVMGDIIPLQQIVNLSRGINWFNTDHSISLIKNPELKRGAWETLKLVKKKLTELRDSY